MKITDFFAQKAELTCWEIFKDKNKIDDYFQDDKADDAHDKASEALQKAFDRLPIGKYRVKMMRHEKDHARAINHDYDNSYVQKTESKTSDMDIQQVYDKAYKDAELSIMVKNMCQDLAHMKEQQNLHHKKTEEILNIIKKASADDSDDHAKSMEKFTGIMDLAETFKDKFKTTTTAQ